MLIRSILEIRKQLSASLEAFLPTILTSSAEVASRLELFRTQTLAGFEPADSKDKDQAEADMNGLLDLMGSETLQIPDIPIINTRAGLYIYLNAAVCSSLLGCMLVPLYAKPNLPSSARCPSSNGRPRPVQLLAQPIPGLFIMVPVCDGGKALTR